MNPFDPFNPLDLSASDLLIWGLVLHLIADWLFQTGWMAENKSKRRVPAMRNGNGITTPPRKYQPPTRWWDRHPAAYLHACIHGFLLAVIFGWAWLPLAISHLLIDTRTPVIWWSKKMKQTKPGGMYHARGWAEGDLRSHPSVTTPLPSELMDVGMNVRIWVDQVFHITCIAAAALLVQL